MKTYIIPQTIVVKLQLSSVLMQMSVNNKEIGVNSTSSNVGLVKGDNASRSDYDVWGDDWSK